MNSFAKIGRAVLAIVSLLPLFAHAQVYQPLVQYGEPVSMSPSTYNSGDVMQNGGTAIYGQVLNARPVQIDSGAARQAGTAIGSVVGAVIGMRDHRAFLGGGIGGLAGFVAGSLVSKVAGVEVIVRTQDNRVISVVQADDGSGMFVSGQPVAVVMISGRLRVEHV
jgi:outer membrane lipoprotein SlyB